MLKPDIAVYRLVSRQTKAAKVSPMKGSFTSAFVLFIRREYTIHASSKKQKPYPKGKAKKAGIDFPQQYGLSLPISLGRLKDVLII